MDDRFDSSLSYEAYEQKGYLDEDFRFFHIKSSEKMEIPYHYHDFHKLILVLGGSVRYMIEGLEYELEPFDFVLVNRFMIHRPVWADDCASEYDRMILYFKDEFLRKYGLLDAFEMSFSKKSHVLKFSASDSALIHDLMCTVEEDIAKEKTQYAGELLTRLDVMKMLISFNRICLSEEKCFSDEARYNRKVIEIIEYIREHLTEELTIDLLSDRFYMSKYHMMRIFKNETGYSIHKYISEKRVLMARDLIYGGMAATTACLECGFRDYSSFSRAFKNQLGILPSDIKI